MPPIILIIANDPNIIYLLERYAEKSGFRPVTASHTDDIRALVQPTPPAVIILEDDFPGTLGSATMQQLKSSATTRLIPVVIYSCLDRGADLPVREVASFLRQSVKYDDFIKALEQAGVEFEHDR